MFSYISEAWCSISSSLKHFFANLNRERSGILISRIDVDLLQFSTTFWYFGVCERRNTAECFASVLHSVPGLVTGLKWHGQVVTTEKKVSVMLFPETVEGLSTVLEGYKNKLLCWTIDIWILRHWCVKYCDDDLCIRKMATSRPIIFVVCYTDVSCTLGRGSTFLWVSRSWITSSDPLPALLPNAD